MVETTKEQFLKQLPIFADLEEEELADLARITDEVSFEDGATIVYQRDVADKLIIIRSGRLYAFQVDSRGIVRDSRSYMTGDYFNDLYLFDLKTYPATVQGRGDGRLLLIEHDKFLEYLQKYPYLLDYLDLSDEAREAAEGTRFAEPSRQIKVLNLLPDEIVLFYKRRSMWHLIFRVIGPLLLFLVWAMFMLWQPWLSGSWIVVGIVVPAIFALAFSLWRLLDWTNDYFVITSKHIIHREYSLRFFQSTVNKTPIDQVQSVEIEKPDLIATLLNLGTARITTAAQTRATYFDYIDNPNEVKEIINHIREEVKAMDAGRAQSTMRTSLEEHFEAPPAYTRVEEPIEEEEDEEEDEGLTPDIIGRLQQLISRMFRGVRYRVEDGNVITYRKHFFTLFGRIWIPAAVWIVSFVGLLVVPWMPVAIGLLVINIGSFIWFIWRFEDWRNDTFQVTDRYVIDIDRRPFGFGESRKQAELGNVQNVNADRPGLLATLFNYGFVYVETAGATADITFEKVVNPNSIQSDIFKRREEYRQKQRVQESERRRQEYAVLVDVYRQAEEQGRIPRRMPPADFKE